MSHQDNQQNDEKAVAAGSTAEKEMTRTRSYRDIFKSSSMVGGANALVIIIRIARAKVIALLIGPAGYGLAGLFQSIIDLVGTGTRFGLQGAGVREIARRSGAQDKEALGRAIQVFRVAVLLSGVLGAVCMVAFAPNISRLTFGDEAHSADIRILSLAILLTAVAQGQFAVLQGLRRIRDLALAKVLGTVFGTVAGITLLALYGLKGIVPLIVAGALFRFVVSWRFLSRLRPPRSTMSPRIFVSTVMPLLALGFTFLLTGLANKGMGYAARVMVGRDFGVEGVGFYSAAWGISGMFVGFVLQAMATDFYPRLCAVVDDSAEMCRLVNEQTTIGILMAIPGIVFFLALAPYLIRLFYSVKFLPATWLLIYMLLGMAVRVVAWPMGYIMIARMKNRLFLVIEVGFVCAYLLALQALLPLVGLVGAGVAWFVVYFLLLLTNYSVGRRLIGFHWSGDARWAVVGAGASCLATVCAVGLLPGPAGAVLGTVIAGVTSLVALRRLERLLGIRVIATIRERLLGK